jgi:purine-nucleoside phosphorylase
MPVDAATGSRAKAEEAAAAVAKATGVLHHDVALIMGSGWVPAADRLGAATSDVDVSTLPGFSTPVVVGHAGRIRSIPIGDKRALVLLGRTHLYEGRGVGADRGGGGCPTGGPDERGRRPAARHVAG